MTGTCGRPRCSTRWSSWAIPGSYPSFTRASAGAGAAPGVPGVRGRAHRESAIIDHPAGEETQFDWLELPDPPPGWGLAGPAHLLVGSLAHSSRWRAVLAESEDQPHLIEALDGVVRRLGGVSRYWRFDRMATVCHPGSGRVTASFAAVAGHYGAGVKICPSRRGQRKGVVEKANHSAAQRWWRTLADEHTMVGAQADLDRFCARVGDARTRRREDGRRSPSPSWPPPSRCWRRRPRRIRRCWRSPARCRRRRWWPSAATPTRCRRAWRAGS